jgi:hypothetical protein
MLLPPSMKVTVPVAMAGETVAVRVTLVPATGVMVDADNTVVVGAGCAVTTTTDEVLAALLVLPLYVAV